MSQNLQSKLLKISDALEKQEVKDMVFCSDNLTTSQKQRIEDDGKKLFTYLRKLYLVSERDLSFLKEILCKIRRIDILVDHLSVTQKELEALEKSSRHISPYRSLLYEIAQALDSEDVAKVIFYLYDQKAIFKNEASILDVLIQMEKDKYLSERNLGKLKETLAEIGREDLREKVASYEDSQVPYLDTTQDRMPTQEQSTNQPEELNAGSEIGEDLGTYSLEKNPHGWCVILNNKDFEKQPKRDGTEKDAEAIKRVFENRRYTVEEHNNLKANEMLDIMKKYQKEDHTNYDSFICFILSHGDKGTVLGVDGEEEFISNLISCFNGRNCETLIGKPKVFFIQACQGGELDAGVLYYEDDSAPIYECDGKSLPITADFLTAYSTTEDNVSLRSSDGSVFIQKLCKILEDPHHFKKDLESILKILHKKIGAEDFPVFHKNKKKYGKQMSSYKSELRKNLILPPPEKKQSQ